MAKSLAVESNKMDHKDGELDRQAPDAFGRRIRERAAELGLESAEIGRLAGIKKQSMAGYWHGERFCGSERLFSLADALKVSARWLVEGIGPMADPVVDADDAAWVNIPQYDLRLITDSSKGNRIETIPIRRDWLNRRLMRATDLWLTELPSDYDAIGLAEGDVVICSDIVAGSGAGPEEGWVCLFRGQGGPFVARYSNRPAPERLAAAEQLGEAFITAADLQGGEVQPIARIHARMLAKL